MYTLSAKLQNNLCISMHNIPVLYMHAMRLCWVIGQPSLHAYIHRRMSDMSNMSGSQSLREEPGGTETWKSRCTGTSLTNVAAPGRLAWLPWLFSANPAASGLRGVWVSPAMGSCRGAPRVVFQWQGWTRNGTRRGQSTSRMRLGLHSSRRQRQCLTTSAVVPHPDCESVHRTRQPDFPAVFQGKWMYARTGSRIHSTKPAQGPRRPPPHVLPRLPPPAHDCSKSRDEKDGVEVPLLSLHPLPFAWTLAAQMPALGESGCQGCLLPRWTSKDADG